jgi:hypothetical protein
MTFRLPSTPLIGDARQRIRPTRRRRRVMPRLDRRWSSWRKTVVTLGLVVAVGLAIASPAAVVGGRAAASPTSSSAAGASTGSCIWQDLAARHAHHAFPTLGRSLTAAGHDRAVAPTQGTGEERIAYRGEVWTDGRGRAAIVLPPEADSLVRLVAYSLESTEPSVRATVTSELDHGRFTIETDQPHVKVAWLLTLQRVPSGKEKPTFAPNARTAPSDAMKEEL